MLYYLKVILVILAIASSYLWVAADDWEEELIAEQRQQQLAQERTAQERTAQAEPPEPEFEPDWSQVEAPPKPTLEEVKRSVKKNTVKAKRKIKARK